MNELPEGFDSVFRYIVVVSQRAEQLINGAKPRQESRHSKPTLRAREDVDEGLVDWRVLTQEELDAQRQAIVEQFRAEVSGEGFPPDHARMVPDVLPTSDDDASADADDEEGERDDELARLQRLLGMVGSASEEEDEEVEDDDVSLDDDDLLDIDENDEDEDD